MSKFFVSLLFSSIVFQQTKAQIFPKEGSKLNYRIVGFSFPEAAKVGKYKIEIATGSYNNADSFKKNIIISIAGTENKIIGEVPSFGENYTWRFINLSDKTPSEAINELHHFSTLMIPGVDTNNTRLRIFNPAQKYKDAYVFVDKARVLYDMKGQPVWFLPNIANVLDENSDIRDIKMSPFGTITFLLNSEIYEINYNGDILWKGPENKTDNDTTKPKHAVRYHHEFTRLANGHYMVMGSENILYKTPSKNDNSFLFFSADSIGYDKTKKYQELYFSTLIEYDQDGNVVWLWKSSKYYRESDLFYIDTTNQKINAKLHDNSFFFNEQNKTIYLSFKDINRIIKIKYPQQNILGTYGAAYQNGSPVTKNDMFCGQHCCRESHDGNLFFFDNNICHPGKFPKIIMLSGSAKHNSSPVKIWEYDCTPDGTDFNNTNDMVYPTGGNVSELPDGSLFICVGTRFDKVFIINKKKEVSWSAFPERWNDGAKTWSPLATYRSSIIPDKKEFSNLVFGKKSH